MVSSEAKAKAIATIKNSKETHLQWIDHLAKCKNCPDARVAGGRERHVKLVAEYNHVLNVLETIETAPASQ